MRCVGATRCKPTFFETSSVCVDNVGRRPLSLSPLISLSTLCPRKAVFDRRRSVPDKRRKGFTTEVVRTLCDDFLAEVQKCAERPLGG